MAKSGESKSRCDLTIQPNAPLARGPLFGQLALTFHRNNQVPLRSVIPITGQVVPDIEASLPALFLGVREVGAICEETVILASRTKRKFVPTIEALTGSQLSAESSTRDGTEWRLVVNQVVPELGQHNGSVVVRLGYDDNSLAAETLVLPVHVTGAGRQKP